MQEYYLLIEYNGKVFYKTVAELPDGATVKNISIQLLPAAQKRAAEWVCECPYPVENINVKGHCGYCGYPLPPNR